MSQPNHKYKRLEALLSEARQVDPDPGMAPSNQEVNELKAQVAELESKLAEQSGPANNEASTPVREVISQSLPAKPTEESRVHAAKQLAEIKRLSRSPKNSTSIAGNAFLIAILIAVAHIIAVPYYVYLGQVSGTTQFNTLAIISLALAVLFGIGAALSKRGQPTVGILLVLGALVVSYPPLATLASGLGLVLGLALMIVGPITAFKVLPRRLGWVMTIATVASGLATVLLDVFGSAARPPLPGMFIQLLAAAVIFLLGFFIIRQALSGNIRTKLVTAFVIVSVLSMGILAFVSQRALSTSLTANIGSNLAELAGVKAVEIGQALDRELDIVKALALSKSIQGAATIANEAIPPSQEEIARLDQQWRSADAADNNADPLILDVLYNGISNELRRFQKDFPQHVELFITDRQGVNIAATNRTSDYYQADEEWWQTAYQHGVFIGQPEYDASSNTIAIIMATAIRDSRSGETTGILRTTVNFEVLADSLIAGQFGQTGHTDIYLPDGQELTIKTMEDGRLGMVMKDAGLNVDLLTQSTEPYTVVFHDDIPTLASQALLTTLGDTDDDTRLINDLGWHVVVIQDQAEALQPVTTQTRNIIILFAVILTLVIAAAIFLASIITNPLLRLNAVADKVASGNLTAEAEVGSRDEVGALAVTFNYMTSQLRSLFGSLEQRVQDRTHDLELASEVGRTITEKISNLDEMLTMAAEMIRSRFELYYTQVYITDATGHSLVLRAGTGEVGDELLKRGHHLLIDSGSLNGQAVLQKKPIIVADTLQSANFKPNRLLPNTRSEMAVPLIVGDQVIGVLDMQSERPSSLNESNLPAFEALGGQLAVALQNASLFAQVEEARAEVEAQMRDLTERGWKEFMNAIDRGQRVGYAYDRSQIAPLDEAARTSIPAGLAVSIPIQVTGAKVGMIQVANESGRNLTGDEQELLEATANQLSQHIENLRLLAQAEGYRAEAEEALRRLTHEGWDMLQLRSDMAPGYAFDLNEVKPLSHNGNGNNGSALIKPLIVREETIGEVFVDDVDQQEEAGEIIEAVARQLSGHIENLRLLETTEYELAERTRTEQELLKVRLGMDRANDAVFMTDTDGVIVYVNPAFQRIYGWTKEEAIGQTPRIIKSGVIPQERYKEFWGALLSNQVVAGEIINKTKDGRLIPIEGSNNPIIDANGKVIGFLALHRDITDRKQAEEIITKHTREMETVAELSTTTSTVLDPDTLLQTVVDLTKERFGLYHAHIYLADESWKTLLLAAGAGEVGRQMVAEGWNIPMDHQQSIVAGAARNRQSVIANNMSRDKHTAFLSNYLLPDTRSEMAVPMIVGDRLLGVFDVQAATANYFSDEDANLYTTLAAQVAVALQNARLYAEQTATVTQLRELDRLKSSFLANMSHELRTPLNSILGFSDVMLEELDGPLTVNMQNDLGLIQKNGQHLLHLINDVLDMAKIESGRMNLNPEKIKVHEILEEVTSITSTLASEKNIALFIETDSDRDVEIFADRTRLRQVMINLVNNSIKFTEKGKISIHASSQNEHILIRVKDTGIGIPADKLEDVFQEFAQVDSSTTRKAGGTGLGLPISRRLIAMHGGRLWAESSGIENEGSTFFVELPLEAQLTETPEKVVR